MLFIKNINLIIFDIKLCLMENDFFIFCICYFYFLVKGKFIIIFISIYVELFGNIEEVNMVCMLNCIFLFKYEYGNIIFFFFMNGLMSLNIFGNFCYFIERNC